MKTGFYPKLAIQGIKKNHRIYIPYILTSIGMVMMYYIVSFLTYSKSVYNMRGGRDIQMFLSWGTAIISVFTVIFLFYTTSFIIRKRKKEFGLYNILGMGKWNIARILVWETLIVFAVSVLLGLGCGILFSKLAELVTVKILAETASFNFSIEKKSVINTITLFAVCFGVILLNSLRQIHISNPIELLNSDKAGEKPPKARFIPAFIGAAMLVAAYYISCTIKDPITALTLFFVAVILVILATYLLFIVGSIVLCKILQKNKKYYYKTNHFVSVSSMMYRMKRNGASLASICILSTMVLVMMSSTLCLYVGKEDNLRNRYPRDLIFETHSIDEKYTTPVHDTIDEIVAEHGLTGENFLEYRYLGMGGYMDNGIIHFDSSDLTAIDFSKIAELYIIPISDYNRLTGENEELQENEVLISTDSDEYEYDTIAFGDFQCFDIKKQVKFDKKGIAAVSVLTSVYIFVPDEQLQSLYEFQLEIYGEKASDMTDYYSFDLDCSDEEQIEIFNETFHRFPELQLADESFPTISCDSIADSKNSFYSLYGGLFLLGTMLSIVFICATVLIMYYKQISEGYEDASRFSIMQKVGMTDREIRKSINSQVLTVFSAPLLMAGLNIGFAFPIIKKLLLMFGLTNTVLLIGVTVGCFLVFALFYIIVYKITSHSYYSIVSSSANE